jgi:hypothetical protein
MEGFKDFYKQYTNNEVVDLYMNSSGKKIKEISQLTGKSIGEIYRILQSHSIIPNRLKNNHRYVLEFAESGLPINKIAELTGYTERNVRYIIKNNR